ncbi:antirepressor [Ligilactobacillus ceti DSM 22408]|uniref:Antirepressor n=1 Tax=Ligilactobacillus ceti DSM 22408 TaxID=1122146 RepID=A0A0R2KH56_9LACO|nr:antirepressor [Ligilactobacillus ceti DSM 22408]
MQERINKIKRFKRWVTSEVLPSIRKNGGYIQGQENLDGETIKEALTAAKEVIKQKDLLIETMKPKALFADSVATSNTTILIGELAKILKGNGINTGQNRLFEWLRVNGYLIKRKSGDYNMPTQKSMELGLFKIKETVFTYPDGHTTISKTTKVTGKGQQYFINLFLKENN